MFQKQYRQKASILLIVFLESVISSISYNSSYYFSYSATGYYNLTSCDVQASHIACIGLTDTKYEGMFVRGVSYTYAGFKSNINSFNFKIRSFSANPDANKGSFIVFDLSSLKIYTKNFGTVQNFYTPLLSTKIINSCFGIDTTQIFILTQQLTGGYSIQIYRNKTLNGTTTMSLLSPGILNDKLIYKNSTLYVSFQTVIYVYSVNTTLTLIRNITYTNTSLTNMDISIDDNNLCYSVLNNVYLLNISSNYTQIWSYSLTQPIISIKLVVFNIYVTTQTKVYQLDYQANATISACLLNKTGIYQTQFYTIGNNIVLYENNPNYTKFIQSYQFDYIYNCSNNVPCLCYNTYGINTTISNYTCQKYLNQTPIFIVPNVTDNSTINDTQASQFMFVPSPVIEPVPVPVLQPEPSPAVQVLNLSGVAVTTQVIGKSIALASMRISPSFLLTFTGFLDDIWYYKYHRYTYPQTVRIFMQKIDIANQLRLNAWFLQFVSIINQSYVCNTQNQQMYQYLNFSGSDPEDVYFLHSSQDVYKNNLIMNVLFWCILKSIHFVCQKIQRKINQNNLLNQSNFRRIVRFLDVKSKWWTIIVATLQINMLRLTFACFTQLLQPSFFYSVDKINLILTILTQLSLIMYCLTFYFIVYRYSKQCQSDILIIRSKHRYFNFFFESQYIVSRNFIRSFVHSYFISNYQLQIFLLSIIDVIFFFYAFKNFYSFRSKIIGFMCILYSFVFTCFDAFFCFRINTSIQYFKSLNEENVSFTIMLVLAGTSLMLCLIFLLINLSQILEVIRKKIRNHKINDQTHLITARLTKKQKSKTYFKEENQQIINNKLFVRIRQNKFRRNHTNLQNEQKIKLKLKNQIENKNLLQVNKLQNNKVYSGIIKNQKQNYNYNFDIQPNEARPKKNTEIKFLIKQNMSQPQFYKVQLCQDQSNQPIISPLRNKNNKQQISSKGNNLIINREATTKKRSYLKIQNKSTNQLQKQTMH